MITLAAGNGPRLRVKQSQQTLVIGEKVGFIFAAVDPMFVLEQFFPERVTLFTYCMPVALRITEPTGFKQ